MDDERGKLLILGNGIKGQLWQSVYKTCITPFGNDTGCSVSPITYKLQMQVLYNERRNPFDFGLRGQRSRSNLALCVFNVVGAIGTTVFDSNFTCSCGWWEEGLYLSWVARSKVKVNIGTLCIKSCGHDIDCSLCPITFKFHMQFRHNKKSNSIGFGLPN